jgi:hypothetical protein
MSGDQFAPIEKPYYKEWQKRFADAKLVKVVKPKKRKRGKKKAKRGIVEDQNQTGIFTIGVPPGELSRVEDVNAPSVVFFDSARNHIMVYGIVSVCVVGQLVPGLVQNIRSSI